jgi:hypothetical protein
MVLYVSPSVTLHILLHTHTHTKLSKLMYAGSILHIGIQSTHQTVRSFGSLALTERAVHSCSLLLLDVNNMNELQIKFVSPATILNVTFDTLINSMYYGTSVHERHSLDPDVTSSMSPTSYQRL